MYFFLISVGTQDSSGTSISNIKKPTKICTSPRKNSSVNSFPVVFRNPETDQNKKVPLQKNVTEFRISERKSEFSSSFNFIKLIPPSSKKEIIHLKKFILDDDIQEKTYKAALRYPEGINELLKVLDHMGRFNEENAEKRSAEEKKFMKWLNIITAKIKYLHLVKISNIKPQYKPALEEIRKIQINNVNTSLVDADATREKYHSGDNSSINSQRKINNSLKILKKCVSRTEDQCQGKNKHLMEIAEYGPVLPKVDGNPSQQININISGTCNNTNSKSFNQTDEKNRLKCSSGIKNNSNEIATKRVQPPTIRQQAFDAEAEKREIDDIINEIYLTRNKNARQTELRAQNSKRISSVQNNRNFIHNDQRIVTNEKTDLQINGSKQSVSLRATDEFSSPNPKNKPCFMAKNFPVTVKREPNESSLKNTEFKTSYEMLSGFLKKKIKTDLQINSSKQNFSLKTTDGLASPDPKSEPCVTPKNFPVTVKRGPNESSLENTEFQTPDAILNDFLKKKIKTEFNEEEVEKDIKKHCELTTTGVKSDALLKSDCKFGITNTPRTKRPRSRFPNGISSAIKHSKGILKPDVMEAFLIHVKRRKYPWKIAAIYDRDIILEAKREEFVDDDLIEDDLRRTMFSSIDRVTAQIRQRFQQLQNLAQKYAF
ncbi:hypothetical protein TNCV_2767941 [Trichonephila clavipes]|nr:hypothetical protein TNCV_2767941 [Trichonephila clavipes]